MGIDWSLREGYAWAEDKEHCEEYGRMLNADPTKVSQRAKKRGLPQVSSYLLVFRSHSLTSFIQLGTLGAGNHYAEVQVVEQIYDKHAATRMGIDRVGQVYRPLVVAHQKKKANRVAPLGVHIHSQR